MCHAQCNYILLEKCSKTSIYGSFKLANRNVLWSFLLPPLLDVPFEVWNLVDVNVPTMHWHK